MLVNVPVSLIFHLKIKVIMRHIIPLSYFTKTSGARLYQMILSTSQLAPLGILLKLVPRLLVYACCGVNGMFAHIWLTTDKHREQSEPLWIKTICYLSGTFISSACWSSVVLPRGSETAVGCPGAGPILRWSLCLGSFSACPVCFSNASKVPNRISISLHLTQIKGHSPAWITKEQVNTFFLRCCLPAFQVSAFPQAPGRRAVGFPVSTHSDCICAPPPLRVCSSTAVFFSPEGKTATPLENHRLYVTDNQSRLLDASHGAGGTYPAVLWGTMKWGFVTISPFFFFF